MSSSNPSQATRMIARILGPYFVIAMAVYVGQAPDLPLLLESFDTNPLLPWVTGAFTLITGLVIVAFHQVWTGAAAVIISVTGWLTILKGVVIMAFPGVYRPLADSLADGTALVMTQGIIVGALGVYLTYVGWRPNNRAGAHS
jgi:hypothetical protein